MLRSDLCDFSDAFIVMKGKITITNPNSNAYDKKLAFNQHNLFLAFQKLIIHSLTTQKIQMWSCPCTSYLNTAKIIQKQQEVFGITTEMNQIVAQITT